MQEPSKKPHTSAQVLSFIVALCFICASVLAVTAYGLEKTQQNAKEFDQSKQMLIAAKILNHAGFFEIFENGQTQRARLDSENKILIPDPSALKATEAQIKLTAEIRIRPLLTDKEGNIYTLEEKNITLPDYLAQNKKSGYANLPLKLFYAILPNDKGIEKITAAVLKDDITQASIFVIPVSGFGLWAPIYGYIAVAQDGDEVIGTTWYEHGETPGLGANITEPWWQRQFFGKVIFQELPGGKTDFRTADMGIIVVKGKVKDVFGNSPKAKSAVDGMSGATLTGDGVTAAYRNSLTPYRAFLFKIHQNMEVSR
jgi:Na+-transporting NADH:ubiquinone oxidoreductase subunit C